MCCYGAMFMFLCELTITLEFLLSVKMVEFSSEPTNNYQLNVRIFSILYMKITIYGINWCEQLSRQL